MWRTWGNKRKANKTEGLGLKNGRFTSISESRFFSPKAVFLLVEREGEALSKNINNWYPLNKSG